MFNGSETPLLRVDPHWRGFISAVRLRLYSAVSPKKNEAFAPMSCCTHVWQPRGVHKVFRGTVTGADFRESVDGSTSAPDFDRVQYVINDFTACDVGYLTRGDFAYLAAIADAYYPRIAPRRVAFVTDDERVGADIRSALRDLGQHCSVRVFPELADAQAWCAVEQAEG